MKISSEDLRQRVVPIISSQAVGLVCGIVGVRLTSQWVDPADYGTYGVFVSLTPIGMAVVFSGLIKFAGRHWPGTTDRAGLLREVFAASVRKLPWLFAAVVFATLVAPTPQKLWFGGALLLSASLLYVAQLAQTILQNTRDHWRDFRLTAFASVARAFAPPLLYVATGAGLAALLGGFCIHAIVAATLAVAILRRWWGRDDPKPSPRTLNAVYDGPMFMVLAVAGWALAGLNRWLVAAFFGADTAGYFVLASNLGTLLPSMLGVMLLQFFQPGWFGAPVDADADRRALMARVDRVALSFTTAALGLSAALHFAMPFLIGPVISVRYAPAANSVLAVGFSATAITTGIFYHVMLLAAKRESACGPADLSGAVCLVIGGIASAAAGWNWLIGWLMLSPMVPWIVNRSVARHLLLKPA